MIRLENVVDTRTEQFHSVVICKARSAKWFVPVEEWEDTE